MDQSISNCCKKILHEELITALGCTEPIAVAYAAAKAREVLGCLPEHAIIYCSGNIVKNVKAVAVPNTVDLKGISAAAAVGVAGGNPPLELEVLRTVDQTALETAKEMLARGVFEERLLDTPAKLHIIAELSAEGHCAVVEIIHTHTGIVRIERDGVRLADVPHAETADEAMDERLALTLEQIYTFANEVPLEEIEPLLANQIACNTAIGREGLTNDYGASIGKTLLEMYGREDTRVMAVAMAAAGSDARMSGCEMPVVINSGSGNQGITVSVPVYVHAKAMGVNDEKMYRALCFANLVAIYQKTRIGRLSAYCGAVNAATGAGAGIAYLMGMNFDEIGEVITNSIGAVSGIVCDGAKSSCAAKITAALQAVEMALVMVGKGRGFRNGEGLIKENVEKTLDCICTLAKDGMEITDRVILELMVPSKGKMSEA